MQWYYLSDTQERIAISEAQFLPLAARGVLRPATPVWRKGMTDWTACGEVKPEIFALAVVRDSDERHPVTDNTAVRGTVIGLSRTLAAYNVWLRIFGTVILLLTAGLAALLTWEVWTLLKSGIEAWGEGYFLSDKLTENRWIPWVMLTVQAVGLLLTGWSGFLLFSAASKAKRAARSGDEPVLVAAIQAVGRFFIISAITFIVTMGLGIGLLLWLGWDTAFPPPEAREAPRITI